MADRDLSGCTLGDYLLHELIGKGGYGEVYRGEQPALEREVVVKVLHAQRNDNDSRERFLREARLAAQLDHLYAAHVYDFGAKDEGNLLWIAMLMSRRAGSLTDAATGCPGSSASSPGSQDTA